ncbi:MAG: tetratricopeptide repeat protein [Anaerolineaceae bacterium]|nr:tetratricopeptide repeat protein [Anaerolineaceae bacterium]
MSTPNTFPTWLKRRRKALDLTREELARQAHCSVSTIRRLEAGDLRPSTQLVGLLATALHLSPEEGEPFSLFARGFSQSPPKPDIYSPTGSTAVSHPAPAPEPTRGDLPAPLTSFVGRKQELTAVCDLLHEADVRLLTLTGPPGTGKTRLSLAAAAQLAVDLPHGTFFVPLAPITNPELVLVTIAQVLGVTEPARAGDGLAPLRQALKEFLRPRRLLLVLDNFEQVTSAAAIVTDLLTAAPGLKILVTSRERLRVYGEHEFPVPPLPLPDVNHLPAGTAVTYLSRYPSIRLFQERARAIRPDFRLTDDNIADVARICAWLDGLPLAIEMAAAQVKWLSPAQVFAQLKTRLIALTGGPRDLTPRQQSLSGAIAWSYHLLSEHERHLFATMGVFVDGCDTAAASAVWQQAADSLNYPASTLNAAQSLQLLAEKSLLNCQPQPDGQMRYVMLETVREYALEQLQTHGWETAVRQAHAAYFASQTETVYHKFLATNDPVEWLSLLDREHHNLRAAIVWAMATAVHSHTPADIRFAQDLVENVQQFWYMRGHFHEARHWLAEALALSQEANIMHALLLNRLGKFARLQGDIALAQNCHEQALAIQERLGNELGQCRSLENLAILAGTQGDYGRARILLEQTLAIDRRNVGARPVVSTLNNLAIVLRRLGDLDSAEQLYLEGTQLCRETNNLTSLSYTLHGLGEVNLERGEPEAALTYLRESITLRHQLGDRPELVLSLKTMGYTRLQLGDAATAARLCAAGERLQQQLGITPAATYQAEAAVKINEIFDLLGEDTFTRLWQEGRDLPLDQAISLALK